MEELVSYLANHQETTRFPDREAKQIRNHPYMTQLDFFDMQDEQQKAWEEQNRQERQKQVALEAGTSLALEDAAGNRRRRPQLAIEDATGGNRQNSPQLALTNVADDDEVEEISRSEAGTMQGQIEDRSSAMALAVRQQLGGLQSNPGTDVPQPILRRPLIPGTTIPRPLRTYPLSREELRAMPAWHLRTEQQRYDSGGEAYRNYVDDDIEGINRRRAAREEYDRQAIVPFGPPNRSYTSMVLGALWDAIRIPELDPDPARNAELWREIEQSRQQEEMKRSMMR